MRGVSFCAPLCVTGQLPGANGLRQLARGCPPGTARLGLPAWGIPHARETGRGAYFASARACLDDMGWPMWADRGAPGASNIEIESHTRNSCVSRTTMNIEKLNFDIHKILTLLPHRYPFLMVDRVLELEPHKSIKALKNVTVNEPFFTGHFPQRPVMPGVMILEALAQTAALLTFSEEEQDFENTLYYFVGIDGARFKRVVEPGDQLILNVTFERYMRGIWKFKAQADVDGVVACEAELMCTVKKMDAAQ